MKIRAVVPVLLLLALGACESLVGGVDDGLARRELADARALWAASGPANYSYTLDLACDCIPATQRGAIRVSVTGTTSTLVYADSGLAASLGTPPAVYQQFGTVERLFTFLEESIARNPGHYEAGYNSQYGYPGAYDAIFTDGTGRITFFVGNFVPGS